MELDQDQGESGSRSVARSLGYLHPLLISSHLISLLLLAFVYNKEKGEKMGHVNPLPPVLIQTRQPFLSHCEGNILDLYSGLTMVSISSQDFERKKNP